MSLLYEYLHVPNPSLLSALNALHLTLSAVVASLRLLVGSCINGNIPLS